MNKGKTAFVIGPGFIGWNVLEILVAEGYSVSALVRREEHANGIRASGAIPVMGSLTDLALITEQVAKADVVQQVATGDNLPLLEATMKGVELRAKQGLQTVYVHTSGAKVLDDGAKGMFKSAKVYYDDKREDVDWVADNAPHRDVDLGIVKWQQKLQLLKAAIMLPPEVYGYDAKHDRLSITVPSMTRFALKHGYPPMVGHGLSTETQIHVLDLARAYVTVQHWLENSDVSEVLKNPYWFCDDGSQFTWREAAEKIGDALYAKGRIQDPKPRSVTEKDWPELVGSKTESYMGLNCIARAVRLRNLGWDVREKGIWESFLEDELPVILNRFDSR